LIPNQVTIAKMPEGLRDADANRRIGFSRTSASDATSCLGRPGC